MLNVARFVRKYQTFLTRFQVQVLYLYNLNIFPKFLVGNVLLHKERIFEMEESYH